MQPDIGFFASLVSAATVSYAMPTFGRCGAIARLVPAPYCKTNRRKYHQPANCPVSNTQYPNAQKPKDERADDRGTAGGTGDYSCACNFEGILFCFFDHVISPFKDVGNCILVKVTLRARGIIMTAQIYSLTIGALAKACSVPTPTIRYYEKISLLPKAERTRADQRRYDRSDVDRLNFIRRCRAFGFSIKQVRSLLAVPTGSVSDCQTSKDIAQDRIADIQTKISDLLALETELKAVIAQCQATCGGKNNQVCGAFVEMQMPEVGR